MPRKKQTKGTTHAKTVTLNDAVAWLETNGTQKQIAELDRYGITAKSPFGVAVRDLKEYTKDIGINHQLAEPTHASAEAKHTDGT